MKYMKIFENFNNKEKEMEELFLQLSHMDELEIVFDFTELESSEYISYYYNDEFVFEQNKKMKCFGINYKHFTPIRDKFYINNYDMSILLNSMIEKYFNLYNYNLY